MTNAERLLEILERAASPICDDCAVKEEPFRSRGTRRQIVYSEAELLERRGQIGRGIAHCIRCGKDKKSSWRLGSARP